MTEIEMELIPNTQELEMDLEKSSGGSGTTNYNELSNKPKINNVTLRGELSLEDLGIKNYDEEIEDLETNKADKTEIEDFITKDVDDLTYYTTSIGMESAITNAVGTETTNRQSADNNLQNQIDAITSSSDVKDIVGTYQELQNYDTSTLGNDDIIKVLQDNTHNEAMTYYRWVISGSSGSWQYIGQEGPYYTKSESDSLLNAKQNTIDSTHKLNSDLVDDTNQTNQFVTTSEKQTWNNKENTTNKVTSISSSSTDTQYPSAKCVYDIVGNINSVLETLVTPSNGGGS